MPYPTDLEAKLGFDVIRGKVKQSCLSSLGATRVDAMEISKVEKVISQQIKEAWEFKQIIERSEAFPASNFFDPGDLFGKVSPEGSYLDEQDFVAIALSLQTIEECKSFLRKRNEEFPQLWQMTANLPNTQNISIEIMKKVDDDAKVRDSASIELGRIRKKLREAHSRIRRTIDHSYRNAIENGWVPDNSLPTIRDGRLVIPIYTEHKRRMKGLIIDESATGQTVYMEPLEALEVNNELRDLGHAENREVIKILKSLTDLLRDNLMDLHDAYSFLGDIDFIRAKAKFAVEIDASMPAIMNKPMLNWSKARHPLLYLSLRGKRDVVPLTIELNEDERMLLVSGPNAGGKSVCLKTVGLLQYMLQCGMLIPISEDSQAGIFDDILIDIGDQQSIENDLSTYSSHLQNMVHFLNHATSSSLVLLDEFGAGTDPNFGGAIAESILQALLQKKVWGVATTHYYNLKLFAGQSTGIRNAAMRFDERNLKPLYQLDIGKPGSSFALEIATNTGLPADVLEHAKSLVGKELLGFEKLTGKLEQERSELDSKMKAMEAREVELNEQLKKYKVLSSELEQKKSAIIDKAKQEAANLLSDTNREIEKTIRHIRENQAQKKETVRVRRSLDELSKKVISSTTKKIADSDLSIVVGDHVRIMGQDGTGQVLVVRGKNAIIQFGELKSRVPLSKLELATEQRIKDVTRRLKSLGLDINQKQSDFNSTLDVRGKRVDEAVGILDQFIDDAILLGHGELRILHGKGEGVLRKVVREQLKKFKEVASVMDEHVERGGSGVTIVVLK